MVGNRRRYRKVDLEKLLVIMGKEKATGANNPTQMTAGEKIASVERLAVADAQIRQEASDIFQNFKVDYKKSEEHNQGQIRKQLLALADRNQVVSRLFSLLESESESVRLKTLQEIFKHLLPAQLQSKVQHSPSAQWTELVNKMESIKEEITEAAKKDQEELHSSEISEDLIDILEVTELQRN
jgi:hypothetical protein